jgi:hypothetical protein
MMAFLHPPFPAPLTILSPSFLDTPTLLLFALFLVHLIWFLPPLSPLVARMGQLCPQCAYMHNNMESYSLSSSSLGWGRLSSLPANPPFYHYFIDKLTDVVFFPLSSLYPLSLTLAANYIATFWDVHFLLPFFCVVFFIHNVPYAFHLPLFFLSMCV